jgi:hypothetical protein
MRELVATHLLYLSTLVNIHVDSGMYAPYIASNMLVSLQHLGQEV